MIFRMTERWATIEEIIAARDRFEAALGWQRPAAYGIATGPAEDVTFRRINVGEHPLPGMVLATVLGYRGGPAAYRITGEELDRAIALLAPAEAYTGMEHPNIAAWRELRAEIGPAGYATVVYADDLTAPADDPYVQALLDTIREA